MRGYQDRTCVRCGAVFRGTIRAQYCSPKCKVYAYRERKDALKADFQGHKITLNGKVATVKVNSTFTYPPAVDRVPAGEE